MNTLSWLLYFSEVSQNFGALLVTSGIVASIVWAIFTMIDTFMPNDDKSDSFREKAPGVRKTLGTIALIGFLGMLFPSQNTVYLIIASESAEMVATSETGQQMLLDIQEIVSTKLDEMMNTTSGGQTR